MAMASSLHPTSAIRPPAFPLSQTKCYLYPASLALPRVPLSRSALCFARRRGNASRPLSSAPPKKKKNRSRGDSSKDDDVDEDAFEALFKQLEEDLKKDGELLDDGEDDISEQELAMLERELEEALAEDEDLTELLNLMTDDSMGGGEIVEEEEKVKMENAVGEGEEEEEEDDNDNYDEEEEEGEEDEEEEPVKLKGWQLRRLAYALKVGRRKTSIKSLAAELCLDRAIVLELLRDPPPNLLMMSAALPDKPKPPVTIPDSEAVPIVPSDEVDESSKPEPSEATPIHVLQESWSAKKRLKKAHINTLEDVYKRTKRPTNAMISSIVQVTNLPRKRVVNWFEDKRSADGVPEQRRPYERPSSESVSVQ